MGIQGDQRGKPQKVSRNDPRPGEHEYVWTGPNEHAPRPVVGKRIDHDDAPRETPEAPPCPPPGPSPGANPAEPGPEAAVGGMTRRVLLHRHNQDVQDDPGGLELPKHADAERVA